MSLVLPATNQALARAAELLRAGGLVVIPTETVYGLAANAADPRAIARAYRAKSRPRFNPLIAHVLDRDAAERHAVLNRQALVLIDAFWPGPLTIVAPLRRGSSICDLARAGLDTIALRAPAHSAARALLGLVEFPLAAPSANRSGHVSPTSASDAAEELGAAVDFILDGGPCAVGVESTIVALGVSDRAVLLRPGGLAATAIEQLIGPLARAQIGDPVVAAGMLARHYAPRAQLRLEAAAGPRPGEAFLAFGAGWPGALNLSASGDLAEAAANLFAHLRRLDREQTATIAVAPVPQTGLGEAINDRLSRAARGR